MDSAHLEQGPGLGGLAETIDATPNGYHLREDLEAALGQVQLRVRHTPCGHNEEKQGTAPSFGYELSHMQCNGV